MNEGRKEADNETAEVTWKCIAGALYSINVELMRQALPFRNDSEECGLKSAPRAGIMWYLT